MSSIQQVVKNIGSLTHHKYDADKILQKLSAELAKQGPALDFVNSDGWQFVQKQYRETVKEMKREIIRLSAKAEKNSGEIQHISNLIGACDLMLDITNRVIRAHQEAQQTLTKHQQGTAGRS